MAQLVELQAGSIIQGIIQCAMPDSIRQIPWLSPHFADDAGNPKGLTQGFLIKSNQQNILIDSCIGNDRRRPQPDGPPGFTRLAQPPHTERI